MGGASRAAAVVAFCAVLAHSSLAVPVDVSGCVYEGDVGDVIGPLAGVTVSLYVSNDATVLGVRVASTTTDSQGSYRLFRDDSGGSEYFHIVPTNLAGYYSVTSTTIGGTCVSADWIRYGLVQLRDVTTDNDFYDRRENHPPVANDDRAATTMNIAAGIAVLANDSDPDGDTVTIVDVTDPPHGTATYSRRSVTYTPDAEYIGRDSFNYTISDGRGGTDRATVTVIVEAVNHPPVAGDDSAFVTEGGFVTINVLSNDSDEDGDPLTIITVTNPPHGMATHNGQTVTYTPDAGWSGVDAFGYTIGDGRGGDRQCDDHGRDIGGQSSSYCGRRFGFCYRRRLCGDRCQVQ